MNFNFDKNNPFHITSSLIVLFLLLTIPLTVAVVLNSERTSREPAAAEGRDPALWPFSWDSPWNLPIGSKAQYIDTQINMSGKWQDVEGELVFLDSTAPLRTLHANYGDWWPGVACNTGLANQGQVRVPDGYVVPNPTNGGEDGSLPNRAGGALRSDNKTIQEFQYATRCNSTGPVTAGAIRTTYNIFGKGIPTNGSTSSPEGYGAHGGSGLSGVGGALRRWEINSTGPIRHALKMTVNVGVLAKCNGGYRWPAIIADSGYNQVGGANEYFGPVCDFRMGSLTAIHPNVDCQTFATTALGKRICKALQDYGAYIVDTGPRSWGAMVILGEYGTASALNSAGSDIEKMFDNLYVIANNSSSTPGGCAISDSTCTRRASYAPEFGPGGTDPTDTTPPTASVTSPANNSTISGAVNFSANASDSSGIQKVEFFVGTSLVRTLSNTPYTFSFDTKTVANGPTKFRVTAYDTKGNSQSAEVAATINNVATPIVLPSPWKTSDIGAVGVTGSASFSNNTFTLVGSGVDIWETSDSFRFVYQDLSGDGSVVARIASQTTPNEWSKAAIMMREGLGADAPNLMIGTTTGNGGNLDFQYRSTQAGSSTYVPSGVFGPPIYLKLTRSGNKITAARSSDGTNFTDVNSYSFTNLEPTLKVGLAVTSHDNSTTSQATFSNVLVSTTTTPGKAPVISDVKASASVNSATITWTTDQPADSQISYGTTSSLGSNSNPDINLLTPHSVTLNNLTANTTYYYKVISKNSAGLVGESGVLTFKTNEAPTTGNVTLSLVGDPSTGPYAVEAKTNVSGDIRVEFVVDGRRFSTENHPPYSLFGDNGSILNRSSLGGGTHEILANVYDQNGSTIKAQGRISVTETNKLEAETMQSSSGQYIISNNVFNDSTASGGRGKVIWSPGSILGKTSGSGTKLIITAKGDQCKGAPKMTVTYGTSVVLQTEVSATNWTDFSANVSSSLSNAPITITFDNDRHDRGVCDRNLRMDKITLQ